jgi:acyl carrier protein
MKTQRELEQWLVDLVAELMDLPRQSVNVSQRFDRFGLDSAAAVSVVVALEEQLGRELAPTLLYDFPTIETLSKHLAPEAS